MAQTLSNLIQSIYSILGQSPAGFTFLATGGSATTFVNSAFGDLQNPPQTDSFKNMMAFVVRDAGGAGASPENKWGLISTYTDGDYTCTIPTVTDAIASGDKIMIAKQDVFPFQQVITSINTALENIDVPYRDITLTTVSGKSEYAIPLAVKRGLKNVYVQTNNDASDNQWSPVFDKYVEMTTAGSTGILYLPELDAGYTIKLEYVGPHAYVSAYNDTINEFIKPKVAQAACILELLTWFNNTSENQGGQEWFAYLLEKYETKYLPMALAEFPIPKPSKNPRYSIFR